MIYVMRITNFIGQPTGGRVFGGLVAAEQRRRCGSVAIKLASLVTRREGRLVAGVSEMASSLTEAH